VAPATAGTPARPRSWKKIAATDSVHSG
jgi:hypothetical protein